VPVWLETLYSAENRACNQKLFLLKSVFEHGGHSRDEWDAFLCKDVTFTHSVGADQDSVRSVHGSAAASMAAASAAASPLNRSTVVQRFRACCSSSCDQAAAWKAESGDSGAPPRYMCAVVEGELQYDHKLTREKVQVPFVAHLVMRDGLLARRHTFSGSAAAEELVQRSSKLWTGLEMSLYAGAAHGLLEAARVASEADFAALQGVDDGTVIGRICKDQGKPSPKWDEWAYHTGI